MDNSLHTNSYHNLYNYSIIQNKIPNITYSYDEKEGALIVNVMGLQFSFHNVQPSAKMEFARHKINNEKKSNEEIKCCEQNKINFNC